MEKYVSVIGGINVDIKGLPLNALLPETSNPGSVYISSGGVGRNIAHNLALLDVPVYLFGAVGDDEFGTLVLGEAKAAGVDVTCIRVLTNRPTGIYLAVLDESRELAVAVSDMESTHVVDTGYIAEHQDIIRGSSFVIAETNLDTKVLAYVLELCQQEQIPCLIEPVSVEKTKKLSDIDSDVDYITPNRAELEVLCRRRIPDIQRLEDVCAQLCGKYQHILVTLGKDGVYYYTREHRTGELYTPFKTSIQDPNGAGDAFVAGFVCGVVRDLDGDTCIRLGIAAAHLTLQSQDTVYENMSFSACYSLVAKG